jgi:hypothetical protein
MRVFFVGVCSFALASCLNNKSEKAESSDIDPQRIYHDYRITAEEERENVTIVLQYRDEEDGEPLTLDEAVSVKLDGVNLQPDSARLSGAYYEAERPLTEFQGSHTISLTDSKNKEHKAEFNFQPFTLAQELPERVSKKPFSIRLSNFPTDQRTVRLVMIDTSFASPDINEDFVIKNAEIRIGNDKLANLALGPVNMEIHFEEVRPLNKISREGGRLQVSYSLRRQFELVR